MVARFSKILFLNHHQPGPPARLNRAYHIQYPVIKKSAASNPWAALNLIPPSGSKPVFLSNMMCLFHPSLSNTNALIILQLPHSLFLKYCLELFVVPQLSNPVEI